MRDFLTTFRFLLRNSFSLKHYIHRVNNEKQTRIIFILVTLSLFSLIPSYVLLMYGLDQFFRMINSIELGPNLVIQQGSLFLLIGTFFAFVINFFFGMYHIIAHFYFSNDVKILLPKPIKVHHILLSKYLIIYIYYLIINGLMVLPFFVIYGVHSSLHFYHWINLLLVFLFLPIVPLTLCTLITVLMMKYTNLFKRKDLLRLIGMILLIALIIAGQFYFNRALINFQEDPEQFQKILTDNFFIVERIAKIYPILLLIINALRLPFLKAIGNVLLLMGISVVALYLVMKILQVIYLPSYFQEQVQPHRQVKRKNKDKMTRSIPRAFARIDYLTMLRVPVYLLNCLGFGIIMPILLIMLPYLSGGMEKSTTDLIQTLYQEFSYPFWMILVLAVTLMGSMSPIASTTFSREGKTHWIMRTLPISNRDHILARSYVPFFSTITFNILFIGTVLWFIRTDYIMGLVVLILSTIGCIPMILLGILVDLYRPLLNWENPQRAVKQNLNVLVVMGISLAYLLIWGGAYWLFLVFVDMLSPMVQFFVFGSIFVVVNMVISLALYRVLIQKVENRLVVMSA